jgi:hypothetical protein
MSRRMDNTVLSWITRPDRRVTVDKDNTVRIYQLRSDDFGTEFWGLVASVNGHSSADRQEVMAVLVDKLKELWVEYHKAR